MPAYFTIASALNGYVLDVEGATVEPEAHVHMWEPNNQDNQLWCYDLTEGVIRSKLNHDYVLDFDGDYLCINPFNPVAASQKLVMADDRIHLLADPSKVLDVSDNDDTCGARVVVYDYNGGNNQVWNINNQDQRYFVIRSVLNGMVLDIDGADRDEGADVIMYELTGADNQLWYENSYGIIASKLNNFVLDASYDDIQTYPFDMNNAMQGFCFLDNRIINTKSPEKCVDIKDNDDTSGAHLCMWDYKGSDNQHFIIEYV